MNINALSNVPAWISAAFAFVIAVATILYVVYTHHLWTETKKSADAAKAAAELAKQSADVAAEREQPMLVVWVMSFVEPAVQPSGFNSLSRGLLDLRVMLKNVGALTATGIVLDGSTYLSESEQLNRLTNPGSLEIPPGHVIPLDFKVQMNLTRITAGAVYRVKLDISYRSAHGHRHYRYLTVRALNPIDHAFTVEVNTTNIIE
ncbi:MAG: hypothetical protein WA020_11555 [Candidatus Acidiferrales bacterium]